MCDNVGWNGLQIGSKAALIFKAGTEFRTCEKVFDSWGDPTRDENASPRTERQRHIAGDRPQHRAKQFKGHPRNAARSIQPRSGNFGGIALRRLLSVHRLDRAVKVFEAEARDHSLRGDVVELPAQIIDDRVFTGRAPRHGCVPAFAGDDYRLMRARDQAGDAEAGPWSKHGYRSPTNGLTISNAEHIGRRQMRQRQCDRLEIIAQLRLYEAKCLAQLVLIDGPWAVGEDTASVVDGAGDGEHRRVCRSRSTIITQKGTNDVSEFREVGASEIPDRAKDAIR